MQPVDVAQTPPERPPMTRGRLLIGLAVALGVMATLGRMGSAALLEYAPLMLVALSPLPAHMLLAVPLTAMVPFVIVGTLRIALACAVSFGLGQEYGERGIVWAKDRYPRLAPLIDVLELVFRRAGWLVLLFVPGLAFSALAGATGMRFWVFLPIMLLSRTVWTAVTYKVGDALREFIIPVLAFMSENLIVITAALIVIVSLYEWRRRKSRRRSAFSALGEDAP